MNSVERQILTALAEGKKLYGLELIARTSGKRGTIYITLNRLEYDGLISSKVENCVLEYLPSYPVRRVYSITEEGRKSIKVMA